MNAITVLTGIVRADGSAILLFSGPANKTVAWAVDHGAVAPFAGATDAYGRAYARFDAGGYAGPVNVSVNFTS